MKLSTKARYGLKACFILALSKDNLLTLSELSARTQVTPKYLEKIMKMLIKSGIVRSTRGLYGGYSLCKNPSEISVGEIFRALEDNLEITACVSDECDDQYCPNRNILKKLYIGINDLLDSHSLQDLIDDYKC
ncbi:MAG TPA: Rrf2 family transcriptional regulator [Clostridiales bacterium]|jgi:Rrf2 family protein|nr:Rrf2 family transcriptional regulator [Clostridiales bacterium]